MTTEKELEDTMTSVIRYMEVLGAKRSYEGEKYELSIHYLSVGSGWAIVWRDPKTGGIDPIVVLGDNKSQAQKVCWDILAVLAQFLRNQDKFVPTKPW